jgi:hypothetical protein
VNAGRTRPNFLVIGAAKAGTTSLFHYLSEHPQVFMPRAKELDFFVKELNWSKGSAWYERQFRSAPPSATTGEASTNYTKYPRHDGVPERIAAYVPTVRLVYLVRDPIERIRSQYEQRVSTGREHEPFATAIWRKADYVEASCYALQIGRYLEHFPREQLLVLTAENLLAARLDTVARVYDFLGVDRSFVPPAIDHEFYRTDERRRHSPRGNWVRRTAKRYIPASARAKELFDQRRGSRKGGTGSPTGQRLVVPDAVRDQLADALREDVGQLRTYMPVGFDGWGIA